MSGVISWAGWACIAIEIGCSLLRMRDWMYAFGILANVCFGAYVHFPWAWASVGVIILLAWMWWRDRRKRRKRMLRALGEKSRALIAALVRRMQPARNPAS